jgi:hypothetical protein
MRLEYEADMRKWISANETLAEADRTPKPLPPCLEKKIPHLFNYKVSWSTQLYRGLAP